MLFGSPFGAISLDLDGLKSGSRSRQDLEIEFRSTQA